jgi:hypothetical protein
MCFDRDLAFRQIRKLAGVLPAEFGQRELVFALKIQGSGYPLRRRR